MIAQSRRRVGLAISFAGRVVAGYVESTSIKLCEPSLDRNLPIRMLPEKSADDAQSDWFVRTRRRRQCRRRVFPSHDLADKRTVQDLKLAIVAALVGQVKWLVRTDRLHKRRGSTVAIDVGAQFGQAARIGAAPLRDLVCVFVQGRKLCHAQCQLGFQKIWLERERACEMRSRFRDPCLAAQRYAAVVMSHEGVGIDPQRQLVLGHGVLTPAHAPEDIAEIVVRAGIVRTQRDGAVRMRERLGQAIYTLQQSGQMNVCIDKVGAQRYVFRDGYDGPAPRSATSRRSTPCSFRRFAGFWMSSRRPIARCSFSLKCSKADRKVLS
jgi:hypothetical protein